MVMIYGPTFSPHSECRCTRRVLSKKRIQLLGQSLEEFPLSADSVEKVGHGLRIRKVRVRD
jgi:hypothetical protein